jgi:FlaG/FlaF family flagellin (archaellin)
LAAVIGTFVLGLGGSVQQNAPQAQFTFDFQDNSGADKLNVTHDGGDAISPARLNVSATGNFQVSSDPSASYGNGVYGSPNSDHSFNDVSSGPGFSSEISAGDTLYTQGISGNQNLADDTFRVIWASQGGDNTATLAKFEGPDA